MIALHHPAILGVRSDHSDHPVGGSASRESRTKLHRDLKRIAKVATTGFERGMIATKSASKFVFTMERSERGRWGTQKSARLSERGSMKNRNHGFQYTHTGGNTCCEPWRSSCWFCCFWGVCRPGHIAQAGDITRVAD